MSSVYYIDLFGGRTVKKKKIYYLILNDSAFKGPFYEKYDISLK